MKKITNTLKKLGIASLVFFLLGGNAFAYGYGALYKDVSEDYWAFDAIRRISAKGWFGGYPDGSFMPEKQVTRAEAVKVFCQILSLDVESVDESSFYDVDADAWYAPFVEAGKDLFPVHTNLQGKTPFQPNSPTTREDVIYALVNTLENMSERKYVDLSCLASFDDESSISAGVRPHVAVALTDGLVSGYPDNTIRAQAPLTRAEFASLLAKGSEHGFKDNYKSVIQSVTVFPNSPIEIEIGDSVELTARAYYTDGSDLNYTALEPYVSKNNNVISVDGNRITGLAEGRAEVNFGIGYLKNFTLTVNVKKPGSGAKILITDYPDETELDSVTVYGEVTHTDLTDLKFICDGKDVVFNSDGTFSVTVSLEPRKNSIKFAAVDKYGVMTEKSILITKICAPTIHFTEYKKNIADKKVTVSGIVEDSDISTVSLMSDEGLIELGKDGSFSTDVNLNVMGPNTITFEAKNKYGKSSEETITVVRYEFYKEN